jgi:hypothetical protein
MVHCVVAPIPCTGTVCGVVGALSATLTLAMRVPAAEGVKVTLMVQFAPTATVAQLLVCEKSAALAPVKAIPLTTRGAVPELVRRMLRAVLGEDTICWPKLRDMGEKVTAGLVDTPVPESGMLWGDPVALSVNNNVADRAPAAVGVKVTVAVQLVDIVPVQVVVREKSPGFVPPKVTLVMVTFAPMELALVSVVDCVGELFPILVLGNISDVGEKVTERTMGTVAPDSLELLDSAPDCHVPPPVPVPLVEDEKVKVVPVGCPVDVKVLLKAEMEFPRMMIVAPLGMAQFAAQVTVAVVPFPTILVMIPPLNDVTT